jgi:hypothetical protein
MLNISNYVSFDLAKRLREMGLDILCVAHYDNSGVFNFNQIEEGFDIDITDILRSYNSELTYNLIDAPTISDVIDWLFVEHDLHIQTYPYTGVDGHTSFGYTVTDIYTREQRVLSDDTEDKDLYTFNVLAKTKAIECALDMLTERII